MKIVINDESFSYDVYSLVKAFYQNENVSVEVVSGQGNCPFSIVFADDEIIVSYEGESRKDYKNKIKREIYKYLYEKTGRQLPWGTLTGIRPTKLPMQLLFDDSVNVSQESDGDINVSKDSGCIEAQIKKHLQSIYLVSDEKLDLSINIAKREKGIIDKLHKDGYSLYIGIPFCPTTCMYCSFTSFPIAKWKNRVDEYINDLKKEIDYVSENFCDKKLDTIYIGGGTPTTLDSEALAGLLSYINTKLDTEGLLEFSVEAGRPDSIIEDKLIALKQGGVTRISVNPQTMNEETLKLIGRAHTVDDFYRAYELSKKYFDNINIDLILGLPGEDDKKVSNTFEKIAKLNPNSLTVHSMAIKRAAHMDEYLKAHPDIKTEITDEMMRSLHNFTSRLKLFPYYLYRQKNMTGNYENIGFAKEGFEGIYNISIMEEIQSIVALGAGSISKRVYPPDTPTVRINSADKSNTYRRKQVSNSSRNQNSNNNSKQTLNVSRNQNSNSSINQASNINYNSKSGSIRIERCDNVKDVALYMERIDEMIDRKMHLFM